MPLFSQAGVAFEKDKCNRDAVVAIIDVLLYKLDHGRFPKTLADAGVKAIDPFDGKPLKYRLTEKGFRIYGVGFDKVDDGGYFSNEKPGMSGLKDQPIVVFPAWDRGERS